MADRYKAPLPRTQGMEMIPLSPDKRAITVTVDSTISAATNVTLNASTTVIEVNALSQGIYMRYAATASATDFDEFILANTVRHYVRPQSVTVVSFIEETAGAKLILIEK